MSKADLDAYRKKDAARKKKTVDPTAPEPTEMCKDVTPLSHYRRRQSYGNVLKSLNSLPSSPRKRTSVIAGLGKRAGLTLECQMEKRLRWNLSKEVEGDVKNFYFHLDISCTMSGKDIFPSSFLQVNFTYESLKVHIFGELFSDFCTLTT